MTSILHSNPFDKADELYQRCANLIVSNPFSREFATGFKDFNDALIECSHKITFDDTSCVREKKLVAYWDTKSKNMTDFIKKLTNLAEEVNWKFVEYKV